MSVSSSPDPLTLPMGSSPVRGGRGPLSSRSINITSPSKSMYLESRDGEKGSPWRIKVTVQAEPTSQSINRQIRSSRSPPKDTQSSSPVKRLTRRSRKVVSSPVKQNEAKQATPVRRPNHFNQTHDLIEIPEGESNNYSLSEIEPAITLADDKDHDCHYSGPADGHHHSQPHETPLYAVSTSSKRHTIRVDHQSEAQSLPATVSVPPQSRARTSPGFPTEQPWTSDEGDATLGAQAPGEATVLESEEFSMISVDSLSSVPHHSDCHTPATLSEPSQKRATNKSADLTYMPSSPPTYLPAYRHTPLPSDSPPKYPAAPIQSSSHHSNVGTPLQESARKSGRALQDVLTGPFRDSSSRASALSRDNIFNGFSSGTRRQLRQSLCAGQSLATPVVESRPTFGLGVLGGPRFAPPQLTPDFASPFQSPVRLNSNAASHRLPTPEEHDSQSCAEESAGQSAQIEYPSLRSTLQEPSFTKPSLASPYVEYDAMSWVATKPASATQGTRSPLVRELSAQSEGSSSSKTSRQSTPLSEANTGSSAGVRTRAASQADETSAQQPQVEESEASKDIWQEEADLWQEEASRSVRADNPPILRDDLSVKPRRAKLPGTWRRTSEAHFSYSDSPEPEELVMHKASAATSASGIMTPPATEDERVEVAADGNCKETENDQSDVQDLQGLGSNLSPTKSDQSCLSSDGEDGDDAGVFWQNNLPSVFNRPGRSYTRRVRTVLPSPRGAQSHQVVVEDRSFAENSPLRNTIFDISPVKTNRSPLKMERINGKIKRNPQSDSALMPSPLRHSLLKSSKIKGDIVGYHQDQQKQQQGGDSSIQDTSSSMASDARQLQNEMSQHLAAHNTLIDLTRESTSEDSEISSLSETPKSYIEELNRESPVRIRVNFNDSSVASFPQDTHRNDHDDKGRAVSLSPQKQYPPLFDNAPSLKPKSSDSRVRKDGFVSRLTDSFWEAVTAPVPYATAESKPTIVVSHSPSTTLAPSAIQTQSVPPAASVPSHQKAKSNNISTTRSVPDHVLRLRRKYGLLPDTHPFTYLHIRTLHRMLNSVRSNHTSLIPCSGQLPAAMMPMLNKTITNDLDQEFTWTEQYLHMVDSYMSLLLPASQRKRLVEHTGEEWGDEEAKRYRGFDSKGRHGTQKVFKLEEKGKITQGWVFGIVEGILFKEQMNERKEKVQQLLAMESSAVSA